MDSKIGFEMGLIVVEAIRGRCASFVILTATVSEIFGEQTNSYILVDEATTLQFRDMVTGTTLRALYLQVLLVCY